MGGGWRRDLESMICIARAVGYERGKANPFGIFLELGKFAAEDLETVRLYEDTNERSDVEKAFIEGFELACDELEALGQTLRHKTELKGKA